MKTINQEQIDSLLKMLLELNIPVQAYVSTQKLFESLPVLAEEK